MTFPSGHMARASVVREPSRGVSPELAAAADQETWEIGAEREVRNLLSLGRPSEAVERLAARDRKQWRAGSPLAPLAVLAHARLGHEREVMELAQEFIERAEEEALGAVVLDLTYLFAKTQELFRNETMYVPLFGRAQKLAVERRDFRLVWETTLTRLALHHSGTSGDALDVRAERRIMIDALRRLPPAGRCAPPCRRRWRRRGPSRSTRWVSVDRMWRRSDTVRASASVYSGMLGERRHNVQARKE